MAYGANQQIMTAPEAAAARNTNSIMQGWIDRGPWQYWDSISGLPSTQVAQVYYPFSIPIGQNNPLSGGVSPKTKLETNMQVSNSFPPPKCLLLMSIGFIFSSAMWKTDIDQFLDNMYMEFRIDDKIFHEGPPQLYPGGAGLAGVSTQTGESVYTLGLPSPVFQRRYEDWSKYIAPLQQFSMKLIFNTQFTLSANNTCQNGTALYVKIILDGLTDRSVQ